MVAVHPRERLALEPLKRRQSHVATANGRFTPILEAVIYLSCRWEELVTTYDAMELMVHRQLGYISRPILHGNAIVG